MQGNSSGLHDNNSSSMGEVRNIEDLYSVPNKKRQSGHESIVRNDSLQPQIGRMSSGYNNYAMDATSLRSTPLAAMNKPTTSSRHDSFSSDEDDLAKPNMPYDLTQSTLQPTLPINNVGIPVRDDTIPGNRVSPSNYQNKPYYRPGPGSYSSTHSNFGSRNDLPPQPGPKPLPRKPRLDTEV